MTGTVERSEYTLTGHAGALAGRRWLGANQPTYVVLLVHGYGEHIGRYDHVAERFVRDGAVVYGMDHAGHGHSDGERALVADIEAFVADIHRMHELAGAYHPRLPVVLVGHSMGGLLAARYAQRYGATLAATVLSAPVLGQWEVLDTLLAADDIPGGPIDPNTLSRDETVGAAYAADPLVWHGPFKRETLLGLQAGLAAISAAGPLTSCPVLWAHGDADPVVRLSSTAPGWAQYAPNGESIAYPQARHEIFNEINKDDVLDDVIGFVRRHLGPGSAGGGACR
ncbi:MAG: alpha/beta hydrolase [Austwickia sp.]|nr:alpha/beta hydrolase [Austwickia sp.]MBK8437497.1 alpha/beta hydrolase [Austwickia sp.]MBK9102763.1 alpha/beta hydrolase [Austwickia sp.]